jgi:hypothetical protein
MKSIKKFITVKKKNSLKIFREKMFKGNYDVQSHLVRRGITVIIIYYFLCHHNLKS